MKSAICPGTRPSRCARDKVCPTNAASARRFILTATASAHSFVTAEDLHAAISLSAPPARKMGRQVTSGWTHLIRKKVDNQKQATHFPPPRCLGCGISMRITRRQAHPERGPAYELQTYACIRCGQIRQRDAATPGAA